MSACIGARRRGASLFGHESEMSCRSYLEREYFPAILLARDWIAALTKYSEDRVTAALTAVVRPLADLMIGSGITLSNATELLKRALFDAARTQAGDAPSDSRVSLLTGLHRKDVRRFREVDDTPSKPAFAGPSARLIAFWSTDRDYTDSAGVPIVLPRNAADGPSFDAMAQRLRFDMAPGTILRHLIEMGLVAEQGDGRVALKADGYLPLAGSDELLAAFEKNVSVHLNAAVENLTADAAPNFERAAHFNRLSAQSAELLEALAKKLAAEQLASFTAEAQRLQQQDMVIATSRHRVSFGSYVLSEDISKKGDAGS